MISVIIPAYNEEEYIGSCLESLVHQRTRRPFEIIVVDNHSIDRTASVVRSFQKRRSIPIRLIREPVRRRGKARHTGFKAARGDILFSTDADTILPPYWIETFASVLEDDTGALAVTGTFRIDDCSPVINGMHTISKLLLVHAFRKVFGNRWLTGCSFAIRREAYEAAGGFNPDLDAHDDVDLAHRVSRLGRIRFFHRRQVTVSGRRYRNGFWLGLMEYPRTYIERFWLKKNRVMLSNVR